MTLGSSKIEVAVTRSSVMSEQIPPGMIFDVNPDRVWIPDADQTPIPGDVGSCHEGGTFYPGTLYVYNEPPLEVLWYRPAGSTAAKEGAVVIGRYVRQALNNL